MSIDITASVLARRNLPKNTKSFAKKLLPILIIIPMLFVLFKFSTVSGTQPPASSVNIEQCANGPAAGPFNICKNLSGSDGYVTGAVNQAKAHWKEGDFLPYRAIVVAPNSGTQQVSFSFDTTKTAELRHAIDYISSYDLTETTGAATTTHANQADPCSDVISTCNRLTPDSTSSIPVPASLTSSYPTACANGTFAGSAIAGLMNGWVSTGTLNITSVTVGDPDSLATGCPSKFSINFTLTSAATVVFAWSGHVAASHNPGSGGYWGTGNAVPTGSPYHMSAGFDQISGSGTFTVGSQDLALAAAAVAQIPTVTTELHNAAGGAVIPLNSSVNAGTSVYDVVTVGGTTNGTPTGTADFRYYTSTTACTADTAFSAGTTAGTGVALSSGTAQSTATGALAPGTYAFKAKYNSDNLANWVSGELSDCEPFTVNQGTSVVATTLKDASNNTVTEGSSVALGTIMHDSATVTLTPSAAPDGSVTFRFYNTSADCTADTTFTGGTTMGTVALTGTPGVASPSTATSALGAGTYAFKANWPGNTNYAGNTSGCETFTVNQGTSTVATTLKNAANETVTVGSSVPLGTVMHDLATVTVTPTLTAPTGNVDFRFYTSAAACTDDTGFTGGTTKGSIALDGNSPGVADPSTSTSALTAGTYAFKAKWAGDSNYTGNTSSCETFTVSTAQLGLSTTIHDSAHNPVTTVDLGSVVHDTATVSGQVGSIAPTGAVTFTFFTSSDCSTGGSSVTTTSDGTDAIRSAASSALGAGDYSYQATIASDTNYAGATATCEPLTVNKAQLGITTTVHNDSGDVALVGNLPLNGGAHDSATVTGKVGSLTLPDVTFYFFAKGVACTNGDTTGATALNTVTPDSTTGIAHPSTSETSLAAGSYNFMAVVAGDTNYTGATSNCEPFTVNKAQLGISTTIHDASHNPITTAQALGSIVHDTATISGQVGSVAPTGAVTFYFGAGVAEDCKNTNLYPVIATSGTLDGGNPRSIDTSALAAGHYQFWAHVAGDSNYLGGDSACEPLTINKAQLGISTKVHDASHTDITNTSVGLGTVTHDTAAVTGAVAGFDVPAVSFTFTTGYTDTCAAGTAVANSSNEISGDYASVDSSALGAGTYAYRAAIGSNDNYTGATGTCEPFTVNQGTPTVVTEIHNASEAVITSVDAGTTVHDKATVTGGIAIAPTGSVNFQFFNNDSCAGEDNPAGTNVSLVSGVAHPSQSEGPLDAGSYSFLAHYNGDANYAAADAACEPLTVNKVTPRIATVPSAGGLVGTVLNDTATVTGGYNPTGSVTFRLYSPSAPSCTGTPAYTFTDTTSPYATTPGFTSNAAGTWRWTATYNGDVNNNSVTSGCNDEQVTITQPVLFWCSPGFWATALKHHRTAVLAYLYSHTSPHLDLTITHYSVVLAAGGAQLKSGNPNTVTLADVLLSPQKYGGPAFNSVANYIASRLGWNGTQATGENCPLDAHGNLTTNTLTI